MGDYISSAKKMLKFTAGLTLAVNIGLFAGKQIFSQRQDYNSKPATEAAIIIEDKTPAAAEKQEKIIKEKNIEAPAKAPLRCIADSTKLEHRAFAISSNIYVANAYMDGWKLENEGFKPYFQKININGKQFYRVLVLEDKNNPLEGLLETLKSKGILHDDAFKVKVAKKELLEELLIKSEKKEVTNNAVKELAKKKDMNLIKPDLKKDSISFNEYYPGINEKDLFYFSRVLAMEAGGYFSKNKDIMAQRQTMDMAALVNQVVNRYLASKHDSDFRRDFNAGSEVSFHNILMKTTKGKRKKTVYQFSAVMPLKVRKTLEEAYSKGDLYHGLANELEKEKVQRAYLVIKETLKEIAINPLDDPTGFAVFYKNNAATRQVWNNKKSGSHIMTNSKAIGAHNHYIISRKGVNPIYEIRQKAFNSTTKYR